MTPFLILAIAYFSIGAWTEWYAYQYGLERGYSLRKARLISLLVGFLWLPIYIWYKLEGGDDQ